MYGGAGGDRVGAGMERTGGGGGSGADPRRDDGGAGGGECCRGGVVDGGMGGGGEVAEGGAGGGGTVSGDEVISLHIHRGIIDRIDLGVPVSKLPILLRCVDGISRL